MQDFSGGLTNIGEAVPGLGDVNASRHHTIEYDATNGVSRNRFDGDPNATSVFIFIRFHALDRGIANEAGQFYGTDGWIGKRFVEAYDAADWNGVGGFIVNANSGCVASVGAWTATA